MGCFPLPKTITSKIDAIQRSFWWSKKNPKRAAYFRSWGDIGKCKANGGLGIRNSYALNRVFISKLVWRMLKNPYNLLSLFMKNKYFPNQNLLEIDKTANSSSWIWKGIVKGIPFIKANSVIKINDGTSTRIWSENWIPGYSTPPISSFVYYSDYTFVNELIDVDNGCWNESLLMTLFPAGVVSRIKAIRINLNQSDSLMWSHTMNGEFTIKSAYRVYMNELPNPEDANFWRKIWSVDCLPKIKFFLWKIFAFMLPVNSLISLYNPEVEVLCPLCHKHEETVIHLFIQCHVAKHIWFGLSLLHLISEEFDWIDDYFLYWHDPVLPPSPYSVNWSSIGAIVMWFIWKLRCDVYFRNITLDLNKAILDVKRMINSHISPGHSISVPHMNEHLSRSEVDHIMFLDGSFKDFNMGIGIVWCDSAGNVKGTRTEFGSMTDAVGAETTALILAISWAEEMHLTKVAFVSDCLSLVQFCNGGNISLPWRSSDLVKHCRSLFRKSLSFKLLYIRRANNILADKLARHARKVSLKGSWVTVPLFLYPAIRKVNLNVLCNSLFV